LSDDEPAAVPKYTIVGVLYGGGDGSLLGRRGSSDGRACVTGDER